jgi:hypothetical protein
MIHSTTSVGNGKPSKPEKPDRLPSLVARHPTEKKVAWSSPCDRVTFGSLEGQEM